MSSITEALWNAHNPNHYPFLSHAFLYALETSGSVGREAGMLPDVYGSSTELQKRLGLYPVFKNFTVTANIFLIGSGPAARKRQASITTPSSWWSTLYTSGWTSTINEGAPLRSSRCTLQMFCRQHNISGAHILHCLKEEVGMLSQNGFIKRETHQYHFHNSNFENFDDFLSSLKSRHRKQIQKERARAYDNQLEINLERGSDLSDVDWRRIYALYKNTYERKMGQSLSYGSLLHTDARSGTTQPTCSYCTG